MPDDDNAAVFLSSPEGHRLAFRPSLDDSLELIVPEAAVTRGAQPDTFEVAVPADLIRRLVATVIERSTIEPSDELDLDLLRRLAAGEGGARTGALKRAGLLEWTVTARGVEALNAASLGQPPQESPTVAFARRELELAGMFDADADYGGALGGAILDVVRTFCSYGHSGGSAGIALQILERLLRHKPLTALTSDPDEWLDVSEMTDGPLWQSRRSPSCFSMDGGGTWYDQGDGGGEPEDVLALARCAVRHLHPRRKVARISRDVGFVVVEFAGEKATALIADAEVRAAWRAYKAEPAEGPPIVTPAE